MYCIILYFFQIAIDFSYFYLFQLFLHLYISTQDTEDKQVKGTKKKFDRVHDSEVYCPHAYLILNFHETLSEREKVNITTEKDIFT